MEHFSVMKREAIENLMIKSDGIYVDATMGGAGHSLEILKQLDTGHLYMFDQDIFAINYAKERLKGYEDKYTIIQSNFVNIKEELNKLGILNIDGILYDLGVSSFQFDDSERGFSYRFDAKLDMRMNQSSNLSAYDIVNNYSFNDLIRILYTYGEEKNAKLIARGIEKAREIKPITTTFELVEVIKNSLPAKVLNQKGHPAKQTFQALRIAVNDELRVFEKSLNDALDMLNINGRAVVITFHSLEDRICKTIFKERSTINIPKNVPIKATEVAELELITKHPLTPSEDELAINNRSHSAKLRVARKQK